MKKKGFTLIELMVSIAIIGLLAAMALPKFTDITEDAKAANVQGNLTSLRTATQIFMIKTEKTSVHDMFEVYTEEVKPEFQEFYSKGRVPEIIGGKNLKYTKKGTSYGVLPDNFDTANDNSKPGAPEFAYFINTDGNTFKEIYAYIQTNTYGANINWREF